MATAAKFVQPIPIFLAYLVPLAVDVVPIHGNRGSKIMGWGDVRYCFGMAILVIIILLLLFLLLSFRGP
jgi:hypothetical protein